MPPAQATVLLPDTGDALRYLPTGMFAAQLITPARADENGLSFSSATNDQPERYV